MSEVQAGRIDVIVVYKVDRLTRSLADFAKIVEVLDAQGASFVSVTQSFNTTTSMGRLTLNVLLSFAQFEREVTGERIRDKVAASKRKGMWMGGPVPLGYEVQDRKLVINETEAATVRLIFEQYLEHGSVVATVKALNRDHFRTKVTYTREGHTRGGIAWSRGTMAHLLRNRVYIGEIKHKQQHFPGEHLPIVTNEVWDAVQAQLTGNTIERKHAQLRRHANLLGGLLFDGLGRRMKSSQSAKGAKRYHYYETAVDAVVKASGTAWRVPAHDTETLVLSRLRTFLGNRAQLQDAIATTTMTAHELEDVFHRAQSLAATVQDPAALRDLVRRIDLAEDRIEISVVLDSIVSANPNAPTIRQSDETAASIHTHQLSVSTSKIRRGPEVRLVIADPNHEHRQAADPALIRLLASAFAANAAMLRAKDRSPAEVADAHGYTNNYFTLLLRLATLAPSIVQAIVEGRQPVGLTRQRLAKVANLPIDWSEQRQMLGFQTA